MLNMFTLASCPWGPATAHGVGLLTEMYAIYMERYTSHRTARCFGLGLFSYLALCQPHWHAANTPQSFYRLPPVVLQHLSKCQIQSACFPSFIPCALLLPVAANGPMGLIFFIWKWVSTMAVGPWLFACPLWFFSPCALYVKRGRLTRRYWIVKVKQLHSRTIGRWPIGTHSSVHKSQHRCLSVLSFSILHDRVWMYSYM